MTGTAYQGAPWLEKFKQTRTIVGLDLDGTFAIGGDEPPENQLRARAAVRNLCKERGVVEMTQTARSWELTLSSDLYEASPEIKEVRPRPQLQQARVRGSAVYLYRPIDGIRKFKESKNWDAALCFGNGIAFRNGAGYKIDRYWDRVLNYMGRKDEWRKEPWRETAMEFLLNLVPGVEWFLSPLEFEGNYAQGLSDVLTLRYRIQLDFYGESGRLKKEEIKRRIREARPTNSIARRIKLVDESNPAEVRYTLYLVPWWGRKESLLNRFVRQVAQECSTRISDVFLPLAGDTFTDLRAGLYGGINARVSFVLVGNSRLTPYIRERREDFGGESLKWLYERMRPTNRRGVYTFEVSTRRKHPNKFVFGAEAYPGKLGAECVLEFLEDELNHRAPR